MKTAVITGIISIVLGLAAGWLLFRQGDAPGTVTEREVLYYRDPMNPRLTSPTPKKSSDGMDYVPVYAGESEGSGERKIAYYHDPMHPWYTSDKPGKAPDCGMDLVPVYAGEGEAQGIKIDPITIQNIGVKTEEVTRRQLNKTIRTTGKVDFDETRLYSISSKVMGWVEELYVDYTGKSVRKDEPLMELYSPELVSTQEEYLEALRYEKQLKLAGMEEARRSAAELVRSARRRLQYWDVPEPEIDALEQRGSPEKTVTLVSSVDGIVIDKMAFKGKSVMVGMDLYKIADLSTVWVLADIYQYELPWVKVGQPVDLELSYLPGKAFKGRITYIYPYLNDMTKTAKVRIEVRNTPGLELKPEMFATVKITSPLVVDALALPDQAIIRSGERDLVVIALGGGYFDPREVKLGIAADGYVQILEGVREGERIVTSSQFLIDSESNLKAAIGMMAGHQGHGAGQSLPQQSLEAQEAPARHQGMKETAKTREAQKTAKSRLYTCEMHPDVVSDKPGDCPTCGMTLIPKEDPDNQHRH